MSRRIVLCFSLSLLGCTPVLDLGDDDDAADDDDAGDDDDTPFDCGALPSGPLPYTTLSGLFASEDFAFDDSGHLISHNGNSLIRQEYPPGAVTPFAVTDGGGGGPASLRMLSTGDLVYANVDTATLYRVEPDGTTHVVYGALGYPTGIDIHEDGTVFLADLRGLMRFDAYEAGVEMLLESESLRMANGMTFSADYSRLFFGTREGIFVADVDEGGAPVSEPREWASGSGEELLGMGVDACDNVYAIEAARRVVRFSPDGGEAETLFEVPAGAWMTNLQWGSGIGGWGSRTLYVTDRSMAAPVYYEVPLGVPSKPY